MGPRAWRERGLRRARAHLPQRRRHAEPPLPAQDLGHEAAPDPRRQHGVRRARGRRRGLRCRRRSRPVRGPGAARRGHQRRRARLQLRAGQALVRGLLAGDRAGLGRHRHALERHPERRGVRPRALRRWTRPSPTRPEPARHLPLARARAQRSPRRTRGGVDPDPRQRSLPGHARRLPGQPGGAGRPGAGGRRRARVPLAPQRSRPARAGRRGGDTGIDMDEARPPFGWLLLGLGVLAIAGLLAWIAT